MDGLSIAVMPIVGVATAVGVGWLIITANIKWAKKICGESK